MQIKRKYSLRYYTLNKYKMKNICTVKLGK